MNMKLCWDGLVSFIFNMKIYNEVNWYEFFYFWCWYSEIKAARAQHFFFVSLFFTSQNLAIIAQLHVDLKTLRKTVHFKIMCKNSVFVLQKYLWATESTL